MATCQAKVNNKACKTVAEKNSKYCKEHQGFEKKITSKKDTGFGQGDTKDKNTGKSQAHNMQPKGGFR
jgi:hypothetical protein